MGLFLGRSPALSFFFSLCGYLPHRVLELLRVWVTFLLYCISYIIIFVISSL